MATTATLNGGPTGGLHTTPSTLIHSDNPPQPETGNSNSSFESGHDENLRSNGGGQEGEEEPTNNNTPDFSSKKRRKQSRPVRIPLDPSDLPLDEGGRPLNLSSGPGKQQQLPEDERSSTRHSLSENEKTDQGGQGTKSPSLPPSFSPGLFTPSPFSSLFNPNHLGLFSQQGGTGTPPAGTPNSSSSSNSMTSALQNLPPHRIFNPEAYCDLCNKEFCNKYFLKTHKANKHGVYSEMSGSPSTQQANSSSYLGTSLLSSGALTPTSNILTNSGSGVGQGSVGGGGVREQQGSGGGGGSSGGSLSQGPGKGVDLPFSLTSFSLEKTGNGTSSGQGTQRESFCELCQKEFCNKYFLKRHKAKIHGIPVDNYPSPGSSVSGRTSGLGSGSGGKRLFSNGEGKSSLSLRDLGLESLGLEIVAKHLEEANRAELGGKEEGELSGDDGERGGRSPGETAPLGAEGDSGSRGPYQGENSCQFCYREFSSKQNLINHMIKRHRLVLPSPFPPFLFPFPGLLEDQGGLGEGGLLGANDGRSGSDPNGNSSGQMEGEYECNLCSRTFATFYLLGMHKTYFHPEGQDDVEGEGRDKEGEGEKEEGGGSERDSNSRTPSIEDNKGGRGGKRKEGTEETDDLRRLQTMIMELNRVSSAAGWSPPINDPSLLTLPPPLGSLQQSPTMCQICNKEFYSAYFLQQHIQHFHAAGAGGIEDGGMGGKSESPVTGRSGTPSSEGLQKGLGQRVKVETSAASFLPEEKLGKDAISISPETLKERLLHQDFSTEPPGNFLAPGPKGAGNSTALSQANKDGAKRPSPSLSRSYCTICHKELCNKYFMRTHMLKMHGISIESSTGLGGVTCDICNKELCSKYFLKVHKQNTHGIVEDGPSPPNPSTPAPIQGQGSGGGGGNSGYSLGLNLTTGSNSSNASPPVGGAGLPALPSTDANPLLPKETGDLQNRYFCHYSEVCPFCGRRFRSPKWLKSHLQQDHGEEGKERWRSIERNLKRSQKIPSSPKGSQSAGPPYQPSATKGSSKGGRGEGNKCAFCSFSTSDVDTMKGHLIKEHSTQLQNRQGFPDGGASLPAEQSVVLDPLTMLFQKMDGGNTKMYRCSYCPFTTSILVYLYAHERTHTGGLGGSGSMPGQAGEANFQCPMCFHTFDQPDAFQQHLIGHQMSGVLAPFFTPSAQSGRSAFLPSPGSGEDPRAFLGLPLLNGNGNEGLYWALKNSAGLGPRPEANGEEEGKSGMMSQGPADLTSDVRRKREREERESVEREGPRMKKGKVPHFRCSSCQARFPTRDLALAHVKALHKPKSPARKGLAGRPGFKCRKCKFTGKNYLMLVVHNKVHHRTGSNSPDKLPEGRGIAQEDGEFLMQGFILTSSEEENSNHFVPSVVYLPVREKVSQSIRVSFSLTPTTATTTGVRGGKSDHQQEDEN